MEHWTEDSLLKSRRLDVQSSSRLLKTSESPTLWYGRPQNTSDLLITVLWAMLSRYWWWENSRSFALWDELSNVAWMSSSFWIVTGFLGSPATWERFTDASKKRNCWSSRFILCQVIHNTGLPTPSCFVQNYKFSAQITFTSPQGLSCASRHRHYLGTDFIPCWLPTLRSVQMTNHRH